MNVDCPLWRLIPMSSLYFSHRVVMPFGRCLCACMFNYLHVHQVTIYEAKLYFSTCVECREILNKTKSMLKKCRTFFETHTSLKMPPFPVHFVFLCLPFVYYSNCILQIPQWTPNFPNKWAFFWCTFIPNKWAFF